MAEGVLVRLDAGSPTGARITYVMNDAAIPLEAFIRTYPEIPNSQSARPLSLLTHAATLGFDPDVLSADPDRVKTPDAQWIAEWATIQRQTEECSPEPPMLSTPTENLTVPPGENLTDRRGDEPYAVGTS